MATLLFFIVSTIILKIVDVNEVKDHTYERHENKLKILQPTLLNDIDTNTFTNKNINSRESGIKSLESRIPVLPASESDISRNNLTLMFDRFRDINTTPFLIRNYYKKSDIEDRVKRQLPGLEDGQMMLGTFQAIMRPLGNSMGLGVQNVAGDLYNQTITDRRYQLLMSTEVVREMISYRGPLFLILRMSRVFGIAPLTFAPDGVRLSKAYYIYSLILIAALKTANLVGFAMDVSRPEQSLRARTATARLIWLAIQSVLTAVTAAGCCGARARCRCALDALRRADEIRARVRGGEKDSAKVTLCIYATFFSFLSATIILSVVDFLQNLNEAVVLNKQVRMTSVFSFFYVEYIIEMLLEFQFVLVVLRLTLALGDVNEKLLSLLQAADLNKFKYKREAINNNVIPTHTTRINYVEDYGKNNYVVREEECSEAIRGLALAYERVCELVRSVDRGHGLLLLLLLQSFFLHFIMTPYYMINLYHVPDDFASIGQQIAWFHFHAVNVLLLVEPCHRLQREMERTRRLASRLLRRARPRSTLAREVAAFFMILTLDQPVISPLGMCVLERSLLFTILGVVSAYLVPRHSSTAPCRDTTVNNTTAPLLGDITME